YVVCVCNCFNSTCIEIWRGAEIIEFPAVLVNLKTGKIEAEFHKYIMPIEWLRKELRSRQLSLPKMSKSNIFGNCAFVTWTDWDFCICLAKDCTQKRMRKAAYFNQWIDAIYRAIYRSWYKYCPCNFSDALSHVGLAFEGRAHSGIDDAKNLSALKSKMVRDGALFSNTKVLTPYQQLNSNCLM
ncbi:hypothetical protein KR200_007215, partial [Drosophila serrata]